MERGDLLSANGGIFKPQGEAINAGAADDVRVLVVGNPANTNALIASAHAPDVPAERFTAMTRLDHNRALSQLAKKAKVTVNDIKTHDDLGQPLRDAVPRHLPRRDRRPNAAEVVDDQDWLENTFIPTVAKRGAAIIEARGASSAATAANAADRPRPHLGQRHRPRATGPRWRFPSDGSYGVPEGLISSFPCRSVDGDAGRSSRASRSTTSRAAASTPRSPSSSRSATPSRPSA